MKKDKLAYFPSLKKKLVPQSCLTFCHPVDYSPGKNIGVGSHNLLI